MLSRTAVGSSAISIQDLKQWGEYFAADGRAYVHALR